MSRLRIAILGAGPIGLEAALYAVTLGHDVTVLEQGRVGENLARWGHVTLFSPWKLNHTLLGGRILEHSGVMALPGAEDLISGAEHRRRYLLPLAHSPLLRGRILEGHRVIAVGREAFLKGDRIASAQRLESPFRILLETAAGEKTILADRVLDATGTYDNPNWMGMGGVPAPGERAARESVSYTLDDLLGRDRKRYEGKRTLLVGCGYSAATSALAFQDLVEEAPSTSLLWITRSTREQPFESHPDDPLPGRAAMVEAANRLASRGDRRIRRLAGRQVDSIQPGNGGALRVALRSSEGSELYTVDRVLANVGYQPNRSIYAELQVHECYASFGSMKLAAALLAQNSVDCLSQIGHGSETLTHPEPGFFILGSKSYGRSSSFLLRIGFEQIRDAFRLIQGEPELDLYQPSERIPA